MKKIFSGILFFITAVFLLSSCVATRKYKDSQSALQQALADSASLANQVSSLQSNVSQQQTQINQLKLQLADLNTKNAQLMSQTNNTQSQLNSSQQQLASQQQRLQQLQNLLQQQREAVQNLKKKMTDALVGFNSKDLSVTQKNGKVYVSLSENLLFPSGSAVVNPQGKDALSKLAAVLTLNPDISVDIEGHTDSIPIRGKYMDNWELSTARANSIVRILVDDYQVNPVSVESSGHSEYDPVAPNSTADGRAQNRRTDIILSPKLAELYNILDQNSSGN
jgi:chemotaxis protein MotB